MGWHFWQMWFISYLCLLAAGNINSRANRRLSLLTDLRANWNAGSWTGWSTIDCLFLLPHNSPRISTITAHEMDTNVQFQLPSIFGCCALFHQIAASVSIDAKIPWLPTLIVIRCRTDAHWCLSRRLRVQVWVNWQQSQRECKNLWLHCGDLVIANIRNRKRKCLVNIEITRNAYSSLNIYVHRSYE